MEETTISLKKYILIYGIILGILFVTYNVIVYLGNGTINRNWIHTVIDLSIRICIIIFGMVVILNMQRQEQVHSLN